MPSNRKVLYKPTFQKSVDEIADYIEQQSVQNALEFLRDLPPVIQKIVKSPKANSWERNIPTRKGWYRFTKYKKSFKIIFKVLQDKIVFLAVMHSHRHPREFGKLRTSKYI